eukprot:356747-Chlamydomonas_euryale.AAC.3
MSARMRGGDCRFAQCGLSAWRHPTPACLRGPHMQAPLFACLPAWAYTCKRPCMHASLRGPTHASALVCMPACSSAPAAWLSGREGWRRRLTPCGYANGGGGG